MHDIFVPYQLLQGCPNLLLEGHFSTTEPANQGFFRITKNFQTGAKKLDTFELDIWLCMVICSFLTWMTLPSSNAHLKLIFKKSLNAVFSRSQNEYPFFILYIIMWFLNWLVALKWLILVFIVNFNLFRQNSRIFSSACLIQRHC